MENKSFELLTKMYSEFSKKIDRLQSGLDEFRKETNSWLSKIETTLENNIKPTLKQL